MFNGMNLSVHHSSAMAVSVAIGRRVTVGPQCVLMPKSGIGYGSRLVSHVYLGEKAQIGEHCVIESFVTIGDGARIEDGSHVPSFTTVKAGGSFGVPAAPVEPPAAPVQEEEAPVEEVFPKHEGGGYYRLSNGGRVKGKKKAEAKQAALDTE